MKRLVYSARRPEQPEANKRQSTKNVTRVCEAMDWNRPSFIDKTANGHRCKWGGHNFLHSFVEEEVTKILCKEYNVDLDSLRDYRFDDLELKLAEESGVSWRDFYNSDEGKELNKKYRQLRSDSELIQKAKNAAENELDEVYEKTGINCFLNRGGFLMVPFAED